MMITISRLEKWCAQGTTRQLRFGTSKKTDCILNVHHMLLISFWRRSGLWGHYINSALMNKIGHRIHYSFVRRYVLQGALGLRR